MYKLPKKIFDGIYEIGDFFIHREIEYMKYRKWNKEVWVIYKDNNKIATKQTLKEAKLYINNI